jgi:signal transduction histidine kinase
MSFRTEEAINKRAEELFLAQEVANYRRTDRMFAWLLVMQWIVGIGTALWISPLAWEGRVSFTHIHVWASILLGGAIAGFPVLLVLRLPGAPLTRHVIAAAQMMASALLIHLTGGRIETHFHVFGSLAFLAFYRDWRVLLTASIVVTLDHMVRGIFWPQSVFGILVGSHWRWIEHVGWVLFEDFFLLLAIRQSLQAMRGLAERQARLEWTKSTIEQQVEERTRELRQENIERKRAENDAAKAQEDLLNSSRMAGMAEIATNVLHNVGNVLNSVNVSAGLVSETIRRSPAPGLSKLSVLLQEHQEDLGAFLTTDSRGRQVPAYVAQLSVHLKASQEKTLKELASLQVNIEHIKDIVAMQQSYAKVSGVKEVVDIPSLVEDSLNLNVGALTRHRIEVKRNFQKVPPLNLDKHKVLQILINLVRNAKYACDEAETADKIISLSVYLDNGSIKISVADNGIGIPEQNLDRIFQHGFSTRDGGHGFGLHSSALAARELGGSLSVRSKGVNQGANFILELPLPSTTSVHEQ